MAGGVNPRIFSVEEANRTLPLVAAIARDVTAKWKRIETAKREIRKASARRPRADSSGNMVASRQDERLACEIRELEREIDEHRSELEELGCHLKDVERGLVDFPAFVGTDLVYLCWSPGEKTITHYHGMREGFIGRRPLPLGTSAKGTLTGLENETA